MRNDEHAEQCDDYRHAAEQHRAACRRPGLDDRVPRAQAAGQLLPEAGHHDEAVIDPYRKADHRDPQQHEEDQLSEDVADNRHDRQRDEDRNDGQSDGYQRRHDSAEQYQEDEECYRETESLALLQVHSRQLRLLETAAHVAYDEHVEAVLAVRLHHDVDDLFDVLQRVTECAGHLDRHDCASAVR